MNTAFPPSPPDDLFGVVAAAQAVRWGYDKTLDEHQLADFIRKQARDTNLRADVETVWLYAWQVATTQRPAATS